MTEYDIVRVSDRDWCIIRDGVVFAYAPTNTNAIYIVEAIKEYTRKVKN